MTRWDWLAVTIYILAVAFALGYVTAKGLEALS